MNRHAHFYYPYFFNASYFYYPYGLTSLGFSQHSPIFKVLLHKSNHQWYPTWAKSQLLTFKILESSLTFWQYWSSSFNLSQQFYNRIYNFASPWDVNGLPGIQPATISVSDHSLNNSYTWSFLPPPLWHDLTSLPMTYFGLSGFFLHRLCRICYTTSRTISIKSSFPLRTASPNWPLGSLFYMLTSQQLPHHPWLPSETTRLNPLDNRFLLTTSLFSVVTRLRTPWLTWWWFLSIGPLDLRGYLSSNMLHLNPIDNSCCCVLPVLLTTSLHVKLSLFWLVVGQMEVNFHMGHAMNLCLEHPGHNESFVCLCRKNPLG